MSITIVIEDPNEHELAAIGGALLTISDPLGGGGGFRDQPGYRAAYNEGRADERVEAESLHKTHKTQLSEQWEGGYLAGKIDGYKQGSEDTRVMWEATVTAIQGDRHPAASDEEPKPAIDLGTPDEWARTPATPSSKRAMPFPDVVFAQEDGENHLALVTSSDRPSVWRYLSDEESFYVAACARIVHELWRDGKLDHPALDIMVHGIDRAADRYSEYAGHKERMEQG